MQISAGRRVNARTGTEHDFVQVGRKHVVRSVRIQRVVGVAADRQAVIGEHPGRGIVACNGNVILRFIIAREQKIGKDDVFAGCALRRHFLRRAAVYARPQRNSRLGGGVESGERNRVTSRCVDVGPNPVDVVAVAEAAGNET